MAKKKSKKKVVKKSNPGSQVTQRLSREGKAWVIYQAALRDPWHAPDIGVPDTGQKTFILSKAATVQTVVTQPTFNIRVISQDSRTGSELLLFTTTDGGQPEVTQLSIPKTSNVFENGWDARRRLVYMGVRIQFAGAAQDLGGTVTCTQYNRGGTSSVVHAIRDRRTAFSWQPGVPRDLDLVSDPGQENVLGQGLDMTCSFPVANAPVVISVRCCIESDAWFAVPHAMTSGNQTVPTTVSMPPRSGGAISFAPHGAHLVMSRPHPDEGLHTPSGGRGFLPQVQEVLGTVSGLVAAGKTAVQIANEVGALVSEAGPALQLAGLLV